MRSLPIVCSVLLVCGLFTTNVESVSTTPKVVIDGCTINSTLDSPTTLSLGTTLILVCRISGIPHGLQTNYQWTCPNGPCQQTGYDGRKINNNSIAINITSTSDGGTYICTVTAEGREASQQFILNVNGGQVVHSYGRLIFHERVITDKQQLQPPNNDSGDGRIECRVSSGEARFSYHGRTVSTDTSGDVHQIMSGSTTTLIIRDRVFNNFVNFEGNCAGIYHYLFLFNSTLPDVSITSTTSTETSITVNIGTIPSGIDRDIIGYHRLCLGVPVVGEYDNNHMRSPRTFSSLVPGAKYRITAWGLGGDTDRRRSQSPAVREVTTVEKNPSPPRHLTITRVFDDGIELNWIPPRELNGDIRHYIIKYTTRDGTKQEINTTKNINYYNLTGLERGQTYNIRVVAVNSAGGGGGSQPRIRYVHNPTVEESTGTPTPSPPTSTPSPPTSTPSLTTSTPSLTTSTPFPTTSTPSSTTSTPTPTNSMITEDPLLSTIAGVVAAAIIVLILMILVIIVVVILIKHKKRAKNKSYTEQVYNDVVDHYDTVEDTKPETVYYSAVKEPSRDEDEDDDSDEGIVEDKVGHLYDDVNKPTMEFRFDQETKEYDEIVTQPGVKITGIGPISAGYDDIVTQPQVKITGLGPIPTGYDDIVTQPGVKSTGLGPISAGYDDIVTQPLVKSTGIGPISAGYEDVELVHPNTTANIKQPTMKETKIVGDAVYAVPDMSKKKGMKEVDEDQEMDSV